MEADQKANVCYVVECSSGSWDDYRSWIAGIFPNEADAEELKEEINSKADAARSVPCLFEVDDPDTLSIEESSVYYEWWNNKDEALEFNSAEVKEYPFGEAVKEIVDNEEL